MTWVITRLCTDCQDTSCVNVCPVDCIYGLKQEDPSYRRQLYIDPSECIDCGACEPECPWMAIFEDAMVPDMFGPDTDMNARVFDDHPKGDFTNHPTPLRESPTPDEVKENDAKWGLVR